MSILITPVPNDIDNLLSSDKKSGSSSISAATKYPLFAQEELETV